MNPEAMLLAADVPGWLLNVRDWWMLNWLWVVRALVEIGVLAVVIYYAFQYLKRTRGWPVVAGFLALLALTLVTELLKLQVLSWLLAAVFTFLVLGASRKSFLGAFDGAKADGRLPGSLACACHAVAAGVRIIRTHDVCETVQAIKTTEAIIKSS